MRKAIQITRNLTVDNEFLQFLLNNSCLISNIFINLEFENEINFISPTQDTDKVSYLPASKNKGGDNFDPFGDGVGRVNLRIGRFLNKFIPKEVVDKFNITKSDIESFVNLYKSWFDKSKFIIKLVEGEEIRRWYDEENYFTPNGFAIGTLWNSCMRYKKRLKFLDLYCKNPNIKMIVILQGEGDNLKVRARALLWENVNLIKDFSQTLPENIKIMDRIYSVFDSDVITLKKWANDNGYIPKFEQNAKSHQFFDIKGEVVRLRCSVQLEKTKFISYPYLDTFPFFSWHDGILCNDEYNFNWEYKLVQADGTLERQEVEEDTDDGW
jgi:hypothetical protein